MVDGQAAVIEATISVPVAGYYRVVASAFSDSADSVLENGHAVIDQTHEEIWLYIAEEGGGFSDTFEAATVPDSLVALPGLARRKPAVRRDKMWNEQKQAGPASLSRFAAVDAQTSAASTPKRQVIYFDYTVPSSVIARPLAGVQVWQEEFDEYEHRSYGGSHTSTDENGEYAPLCAPTENYAVLVQRECDTWVDAQWNVVYGLL